MTLEEVVYQIDGELKEEEEVGRYSIKISLLDNTKDVCAVRGAHIALVEACAKGKTLAEARRNLVCLLRGNVLFHNWPIQWKTYTDSLRVPESLKESDE